MSTGSLLINLLLSILEELSRWVFYVLHFAGVCNTHWAVCGWSVVQKFVGHTLTTAPALQCAPHYTCSAHYAVPGSTCDVWSISLRRGDSSHHAAPHCISQAHHAARRWAPPACCCPKQYTGKQIFRPSVYLIVTPFFRKLWALQWQVSEDICSYCLSYRTHILVYIDNSLHSNLEVMIHVAQSDFVPIHNLFEVRKVIEKSDILGTALFTKGKLHKWLGVRAQVNSNQHLPFQCWPL